MKTMTFVRNLCFVMTLLLLGFGGRILRAGEPPANPNGKWKWVAPLNPDGKVPNITFTLKFTGGKFTGTRTSSSGMVTTLTNGVFKGGVVSFQTLRTETRGPRGVTNYGVYSGKLAGDRIKGKVEIFINEKTMSSDEWEIQRVKE